MNKKILALTFILIDLIWVAVPAIYFGAVFSWQLNMALFKLWIIYSQVLTYLSFVLAVVLMILGLIFYFLHRSDDKFEKRKMAKNLLLLGLIVFANYLIIFYFIQVVPLIVRFL